MCYYRLPHALTKKKDVSLATIINNVTATEPNMIKGTNSNITIIQWNIGPNTSKDVTVATNKPNTVVNIPRKASEVTTIEGTNSTYQYNEIEH